MLRIAALGMFVAWLTATSVDWLYNFPGLAGAAMLAAALVVVPVPIRERSAEPPAGRSRTTRAVLVIGIAALGLAAASIGRQYAASRYAASAASAVRTHPTAAIATLRTAEQLDPNALTTLYAIASAYAQLDDYRDARAALLDAERREPHNYVPPALLGDLATRRGYPRIAEAAYARALRLDPREPVLQAALAAARKATG
jgi:cytochrome c-type biogenesis protein CcmH/NrfG